MREDTARGARSLNMAIWTQRDHWMNGDGVKEMEIKEYVQHKTKNKGTSRTREGIRIK